MFTLYGLEDELEDLNPEYFDSYLKFLTIYDRVRSDFIKRFNGNDKNSFTYARRIVKNCDKIIDTQVDDLNEDDIYCLLLAAMFVGCGMDDDDQYYNTSLEEIIADDHLRNNPIEKIMQMIFKLHFEFSSALMEQAQFLVDLVDDEHRDVVRDLCKIKTKADVFSKLDFKHTYKLSNGNEIHFGYIASVLFLAVAIDNATEVAKYAKDSVLEYDKFTEEYIYSLKCIEDIKVRKHSVDLLMKKVPEDNLGFRFYIQELKDYFVSAKDFVEANSFFRIKQNKINVVDLNNLATKIF